MISGKEHTIGLGAHRDAPPTETDEPDQQLVQTFREITLVLTEEEPAHSETNQNRDENSQSTPALGAEEQNHHQLNINGHESSNQLEDSVSEGDYARLQQENAELLKRVASLEESNLQLEESKLQLEEENQSLRQQLDSLNGVAKQEQVISDPDSTEDYFVLYCLGSQGRFRLIPGMSFRDILNHPEVREQFELNQLVDEQFKLIFRLIVREEEPKLSPYERLDSQKDYIYGLEFSLDETQKSCKYGPKLSLDERPDSQESYRIFVY